MRILAALCCLTSAILCLLLAGFLLVSAKYEKFEAKVKAEDDLSSVAGDLVSEEELEQMRQKEQAKLAKNAAVQGAGYRSTLLGVLAAGAGVLQIIGCVLIMVRRARIAVLLLLLCALAATLSVLFMDSPITLGAIAAGLTIAAAICHAPALRRRAAP